MISFSKTKHPRL